MTDSSLELASLLCSRLCHDLLSPVGALNNGLELLAEEREAGRRDGLAMRNESECSLAIVGADGVATYGWNLAALYNGGRGHQAACKRSGSKNLAGKRAV